MSPNKNGLALILLLTLSLIWGTSFILIKQGLKVFSPDMLGALRVTAAAIFFIAVGVATIKRTEAR